jgi:hypothetical protein
MRRLLPTVLAALMLAGCKLIDQTTFAPATERPAPADIAALPPVGNRTALLTIRYTTPSPDYAGAMRAALRLTRERRPGADFDVVAAVPAAQDPAMLEHDLAQARADAAGVMRSMIALGVPDDRIRLAARIDPAITVREVRVYVR